MLKHIKANQGIDQDSITLPDQIPNYTFPHNCSNYHKKQLD